MPEYYKLSLLRKTESGVVWEYAYFKIDGEKSKILHYQSLQTDKPLNSKLEKISEEEVKEVIKESGVERSAG